jgi:hypothetical protein
MFVFSYGLLFVAFLFKDVFEDFELFLMLLANVVHVAIQELGQKRVQMGVNLVAKMGGIFAITSRTVLAYFIPRRWKDIADQVLEKRPGLFEKVLRMFSNVSIYYGITFNEITGNADAMIHLKKPIRVLSQL